MINITTDKYSGRLYIIASCKDKNMVLLISMKLFLIRDFKRLNINTGNFLIEIK